MDTEGTVSVYCAHLYHNGNLSQLPQKLAVIISVCAECRLNDLETGAIYTTIVEVERIGC